MVEEKKMDFNIEDELKSLGADEARDALGHMIKHFMENVEWLVEKHSRYAGHGSEDVLRHGYDAAESAAFPGYPLIVKEFLGMMLVEKGLQKKDAELLAGLFFGIYGVPKRVREAAGEGFEKVLADEFAQDPERLREKLDRLFNKISEGIWPGPEGKLIYPMNKKKERKHLAQVVRSYWKKFDQMDQKPLMKDGEVVDAKAFEKRLVPLKPPEGKKTGIGPKLPR